MPNIWNKDKTSRAGRALMKAALDAGGTLTYSQGWEKIRARKSKGIVTGIIGSYTTYDEIVNDLVGQGFFGKDDDPEDKRVTILRVLNADQATAELQFQETFDQIKGLVQQPSFPISQEEWKRHQARILQGKTHIEGKQYEELWKHPYLTQREKVRQLVKISHTLLFKTETVQNPEGAWVSTHPDPIKILTSKVRNGLDNSHAMLQKILAEGKKDPDKENWLKQLGAYKQQ